MAAGRWPASCTPSSVDPAWGPSACASPVASHSRCSLTRRSRRPCSPSRLRRRRGKGPQADWDSAPATSTSVKTKVAAGCQVLGLRYERDPAVGTRFDTLRRELGDNFIAVEFPGRKHATLTEHRQQDGVDRVLAFFEEKLKVASDQQPDEVSGLSG